MRMRQIVASVAMLAGCLLHSPTYGASLTPDESLVVPLNQSTTAVPSATVYVPTSETLVGGGANFTVGDIVYNSQTGSQYRVAGISSPTTDPNSRIAYGSISSLTLLYYGASNTDPTGQTVNLVPLVAKSTVELVGFGNSPMHRITNATIKIDAMTKTTIVPTDRTLLSRATDEYNPRDYGVKLDGSSDDVTAFAKFYAIIPDRTVIKFPCDTILPPWPSHPDGYVGYSIESKHVTWYLRCVGQWGAGAGVTEQHQIPRGRAYMLWQKKQLEQEKDYFLAHKNDPLSPGGSLEAVHPLLSHTSPRPSDLTIAAPTEKSKDKK